LDHAYSIILGKSIHFNVVLVAQSNDDSSLVPLLTFIVFIILISVGSFLALRTYRRASQEANRSNNWPTVVGEIVSSTIGITNDGEGGVYYQPVITYSYNVGGRDYQANRVFVGHELAYDFGKKWTEETVSKYRVDTNIAVYYDPHSPEKAVLVPGITPQIKRIRFGMTIVCCFLAPFAFALSLLVAVVIQGIIL
jgi:hypothetical protein